jgi:hypothetical protein
MLVLLYIYTYIYIYIYIYYYTEWTFYLYISRNLGVLCSKTPRLRSLNYDHLLTVNYHIPYVLYNCPRLHYQVLYVTALFVYNVAYIYKIHAIHLVKYAYSYSEYLLLQRINNTKVMLTVIIYMYIYMYVYVFKHTQGIRERSPSRRLHVFKRFIKIIGIIYRNVVSRNPTFTNFID